MHDVLNPWANPVTYGVPFFLLAVVFEVLALKQPARDGGVRGYQGKDAATSLLMGAGSLVTISAVKVAGFVVYTAVYAHVALWHLSMRTWWSWALAIVGVDLAYYCYHRFTHRVRVGWAAHQAHHSSEYMNFSTALRQKWNPYGLTRPAGTYRRGSTVDRQSQRQVEKAAARWVIGRRPRPTRSSR